VRIAMNLKEIPYDIKPISLIKSGGEQHCNEYREVNPMEQVPALQIGKYLPKKPKSTSFTHHISTIRWTHPHRIGSHNALPGGNTSPATTPATGRPQAGQGARNSRDHLLWHPAPAEPHRAHPCGRGEEEGVGPALDYTRLPGG